MIITNQSSFVRRRECRSGMDYLPTWMAMESQIFCMWKSDGRVFVEGFAGRSF